jgi:hypothetical protein
MTRSINRQADLLIAPYHAGLFIIFGFLGNSDISRLRIAKSPELD